MGLINLDSGIVTKKGATGDNTVAKKSVLTKEEVKQRRYTLTRASLAAAGGVLVASGLFFVINPFSSEKISETKRHMWINTMVFSVEHHLPHTVFYGVKTKSDVYEKYGYPDEVAYRVGIYDNDLWNTNITDLVDKDKTSLDELLTEEEVSAYERFKVLLNAKKYYDSKDLDAYDSYDIDYNSIDYDHMISLNDKYYDLVIDGGAEFDAVCREMKSIKLSIEKYQKEYGATLVEKVAAKVLVSKAIDGTDINPAGVSNIKMDIDKKDRTRVSFETENNKEYISDVFGKQGTDYAENIGKDLKDGDLIKTIIETKYLAADTDYEMDVKKR